MRFDDPAFLERAYGTDEGLSVRSEVHRSYGVLRRDFFELMTEEAAERLRPGRILDVGAGTGNWHAAIRRVLGPEPDYVALDRSEGMVQRLRREVADDARAEVLVGDAEHLPCAEGHFHWVGLHFMLYHVPDIARALCEAWRVLSPGGLLLAAANGPEPYHELLDMQREALSALGFPVGGDAVPSDRFNLENGAEWFPSPPEVVRYSAGFRFDAAEPAVAYLASGPVDAAIAQAGAGEGHPSWCPESCIRTPEHGYRA